MTPIRLKVLPRYPTDIVAGDGITVTKDGKIITIGLSEASGDVVGPPGNVDSHVAVFEGTGNVLRAPPLFVDTNGTISGTAYSDGGVAGAGILHSTSNGEIRGDRVAAGLYQMARRADGPWIVSDPDARVVLDSSTTAASSHSQGLQEAINLALTNQYQLIVRGGGNGDPDAEAPANTQQSIYASDGINFGVQTAHNIALHGISLFMTSDAPLASPSAPALTVDGITYESADMPTQHWDGQFGYHGTGAAIRIKPTIANQEGFTEVYAGSFRFPSVIPSFTQVSGDQGTGIRITPGNATIGGSLFWGREINTGGTGLQIDTPGSGEFTSNTVEFLSIHGIVGTGVKIGTGATSKIFGNDYSLAVEATVTGIDSYASSELLRARITGTGATGIKFHSGANNNIVINPINTATAPIIDQGNNNTWLLPRNLATGLGGIYLSGGSTLVGSVWTAQNTTASSVALDGSGNVIFYGDTGLTAGNTFSPTETLRIIPTSRGLRFSGPSSGNPIIVPQSAAGNPTLTLPNQTGTFAVGATAPLALDTGTGNLTLPDFYIGTTAITPTVTYVGDSLTMGVGGTHPYNFYITPPTYNGLALTGTNIGVSGRTVATMLSAAPSNLNPLFSNNSGMNVAVIWGGVNDLAGGASAAQTFSTIEILCQHLRQVGFKVIVATMTSDGTFDAARSTINTNLRSYWTRFADGLADLAANANIGVLGAYSNATYFNVDQRHLTDAGYTIVAGIVQTALTTVVTTATVNANIGSFGSATSIPVVTVNAKGQVTSVTTATPTVTSVNGISYPNAVVSGGVLFGNSTTSVISSNLLAQHSVVVGGGAGNPPGTISAGANGTVLAGVTGSDPAFTATLSGLTSVGATTFNKVTLTPPATGSTLTIADGKTVTHNATTTFAGADGKTLTISNSGTLAGGDAFTLAIAAGKTLTASNTLTLTGTDGSSVAFGTGGTVAYTANNLSVFASTTSAQLHTLISDPNGTGTLLFNNGCTLVGPALGSATATQITMPLLYGGTAVGSNLQLTSTSNGSPSGDYIQLTAGGINSRLLATGDLIIGGTALTVLSGVNNRSFQLTNTGASKVAIGQFQGGDQAFFVMGANNANTNSKYWDFLVSGSGTESTFDIRIVNDAYGAATSVLGFTRTGTTAGTATFSGNVATKSIRGTAVAFASVPASPVEGMMVAVTDSTTATWGATITGGGANHVQAYYNGTNWTVSAK